MKDLIPPHLLNPETMLKAEPFKLRRAPDYAGDQTITDIWKALEADERFRAVQESGTGKPGSIEEP